MEAAKIISYEPRYQEALERFFEEVWRNGPFPFDPKGNHSDLLDIPKVYQVSGGDFFILKYANGIAGVVAVRALTLNIAEIKRLNVVAQNRGLGWGDLLFKKAVKHARSNGFKRIRLDTIDNPGPAIHLFRKHGFVEIERYNNNPDANLFMELELRA